MPADPEFIWPSTSAVQAEASAAKAKSVAATGARLISMVSG
jgi:hypothetical protein